MGEKGKILEFPNGNEVETREADPAAIEIGRFVSDEEGFKVLVRCEVHDGEVVIQEFDGGENIARNIRERGITAFDNTTVFPGDGKKFFEALRVNFKTPYCYAREKNNK